MPVMLISDSCTHKCISICKIQIGFKVAKMNVLP